MVSDIDWNCWLDEEGDEEEQFFLQGGIILRLRVMTEN